MDNLYENYRNQKEVLLEALVERDYMEIYQSNILKTDFIIKLGEPKYELHKLELTIARTKLKLEMMQTCIHMQIPIDSQHIDNTLEKEFANHFGTLKVMKKEIESVNNREAQSGNLVQSAEEAKRLYFSIAKRLHPELVTVADRKSSRLWKTAKSAYESKDSDKLRKLYNRVLKEYPEVEADAEPPQEIKKAVKALKSKTKNVLSEIASLKKQFPFNEAKLLENDEAIQKSRNEIAFEIRIAREFLDKLEKQILEKLPPVGNLLH